MKLKKIDNAINKQNNNPVIIQTTSSQIDQNLVLSTVSRQEHQVPPAAHHSFDDKSSLMQYEGKRITWADSDYLGDPYIVFIGIDINE